MAKVTVDVAKETTSQEIKSLIVPKDLLKVSVGFVDFANDDVIVISGGINSNAREITTA